MFETISCPVFPYKIKHIVNKKLLTTNHLEKYRIVVKITKAFQVARWHLKGSLNYFLDYLIE